MDELIRELEGIGFVTRTDHHSIYTFRGWREDRRLYYVAETPLDMCNLVGILQKYECDFCLRSNSYGDRRQFDLAVSVYEKHTENGAECKTVLYG